ncbi:alpha carbonic anhydrase 4 [Perilla frutescens var. frutescens]|nr:alpha carbonic anhydrase 4 [Perilla frutescens var. frutescens]
MHNSVHRFTACLIGLSLLMVINAHENHSHEVAEDEHPFMYLQNSSKGPEHWGKLKKEWKSCHFGKFQSPIDLPEKRVTLLSEMGRLRRTYKPAHALLKNRGHDIMIEWKGYAGGAILSGTMYNLLQCHWHTPSEHTVGGRRYDLEVHMVHNSYGGQTAVIAILYEFGHPDPFLDKILVHLNDSKSELEGIDLGDVNPWEIKFGSRKYFRYLGSLTVPPCTEGVLWTLIRKVRTASREQIRALREALHDGFENNARPIQPLNGRNMYMYRP